MELANNGLSNRIIQFGCLLLCGGFFPRLNCGLDVKMIKFYFFVCVDAISFEIDSFHLLKRLLVLFALIGGVPQRNVRGFSLVLVKRCNFWGFKIKISECSYLQCFL